MIKRALFVAVLPVVLSVLASGCNRGQVSVDETYAVMRPVKQLELPDQVSDNLVITIGNVADQSSSYKNTVELEINNRKVRPNWDVSNVENTYTYRLRLRPGYYKVKATYHAYIGWGEERYPIETQDLVQVSATQRTLLNCTIAKRPNGEPVDKKMYFKTQYEPLDAVEVEPQPAISEPAKTTPAASAPTVPVSRQTIALQINTIPERCQIILDDQVMGQSPMRVSVTRDSDHVLQASAEGYRTGVKVLNRAAFAGKDQLIVIMELEKSGE
ncbi:PEGA domain-containing protein [candidate division KSB1 bacterium]|nr:PEGA domain-containing protein [candidate division KSB1 bacterium]